MTLGGTRNVAMTAVGQVLRSARLTNAPNKIDPPVNPTTKILRGGGNYWGD